MASDLARAVAGTPVWSSNSIQQTLLPEQKCDHLQVASGLTLTGLDLVQPSFLSQEIHTKEFIALNCPVFNFRLC